MLEHNETNYTLYLFENNPYDKLKLFHIFTVDYIAPEYSYNCISENNFKTLSQFSKKFNS